eukprot:CAMPEP_0170454080 /NCGR_PEP_ID=MMETSP0123-20130129/2450_1 /TAXON_ID=182087 /ORGANISM="Favella ehrenbergii, Strain Fehren 1" /LENGTH=81 /DNA_ID=CAMNT_0010716671 /DNA_START=449 /DNA_END=694 /DNA_ORIENTATION=-
MTILRHRLLFQLIGFSLSSIQHRSDFAIFNQLRYCLLLLNVSDLSLLGLDMVETLGSLQFYHEELKTTNFLQKLDDIKLLA